MKKLILLLVVVGLLFGAWFVLSGGYDQTKEERVHAALTANGIPVGIADCMAPKMVEDLSVSQLLALEELAAQDGEEPLPTSMGEALERLQRVDDAGAVATLVGAGSRCALSSILG